jgi:hypothetical protein
MKKLVYLLILLPFITIGQYFSGEIIYNVQIIPKSDTVDIEEIRKKVGFSTSILITSKKYKFTYYNQSGQQYYSYSYDDQISRMYNDYEDVPYITFQDSRKSNNENPKRLIHMDSTSIVLGHPCYLVTTNASYGTTKSYYSKDIKVNPEDFKEHKIGNWYNKLKEVNGSILLKSINEYETYIHVYEAIKITPKKVTTRDLALAKKPIVASYYDLSEEVQVEQLTPALGECYKSKALPFINYDGRDFHCILKFVVQKDGQIKFVQPYQAPAASDKELYKVAIDILENCGFEFIPGKINGKPVDSEMYFPLYFKR